MNSLRMAATKAFRYQMVLLVCFISVTSKTDIGKILVQSKEIQAIDAVDVACDYGTSITLKSGRKICSIEQLPQIQEAIATKRLCL